MDQRRRYLPIASVNWALSPRRSYRVADVCGGGGGLALGAALAGFQLAAKREGPRATGIALMQANEALLGTQWYAQADLPARWRPCTADVIVCSTVDLIEDVLRYTVDLHPTVLVVDAVTDVLQSADLAARLNHAGGDWVYRATTVDYNDLSLGGAMDRPRTFHVLSQIPFGVEPYALDWIPSSLEAVADLSDLELSWDEQQLTQSPTWYSRTLRTPEHTVDGHAGAAHYRTSAAWNWSRPGWPVSTRARRPVGGRRRQQLTQREIARLMGFPDIWRLGTAPRPTRGTYIGAAWDITTSLCAAYWIMQWVYQALDGRPGNLREPHVDLSRAWEPLAVQRWGESRA